MQTSAGCGAEKSQWQDHDCPSGEEDTEYIACPRKIVVEASSSSETLNLHRKRSDYEKYGVGEHVVFLVCTRAVVWLFRGNDKFVDLKPSENGIL